MSTPANEGPEAQVEKRKGLSKIVSRMKTVLKRSDGSKRLSFSSRAPVAATASASAGPSEPAANIAAPALVEALVEPSTAPEGPQPTKILRSQIQAERARKLAERFNVTITPEAFFTFSPDREAFRIEKPIRMRIHRTCHRCKTTFGANKVCASCQHTRCAKCSRYPAKKDEASGKKKERKLPRPPMAGDLEVDTYYGLTDEILLTKPSKTGGQPLVRKKPMQRVRRTCCQPNCSTLFISGSRTCSNCQHARCADCPRDPPKKKKYPDGYPGDQPSATSTDPIKYACHRCNKTYPPVPHPNSPEGQALGDTIEPLECTRCGHPRCADCRRAQPQKVEPQPDPEVVKSVEAKLAALRLSSTAET